jgi:hypothetical protein
MPALVTNKFRIHNAKQFVESISEPAAVEVIVVPPTEADSLIDSTNCFALCILNLFVTKAGILHSPVL